MILSEKPAAAAGGRRPPAPPSSSRATGLTIYGCGPEEADLFRELAPRFGVLPTITDAALCDENAGLASGSQCVSITHKAEVRSSTLLALRQAGVQHLSTRSVGRDHIDVRFARSIGLSVGTVAYSPDSVADYTLMLMLMAVRGAKATMRRAEAQDFRLGGPGRELRDLTVGVVGTGRIGTAVVERLAGFGCRVLTHDDRPGSAGGQVPLDTLLRLSDVVTLHVPLQAGTEQLLSRERIARLKRGAFVVNTARGALVDTEALLAALESGELGGAALDVLEGEEGIFYADHRERPIGNEALLRLQRLPNVIVTPHTAYYTDHALRDLVENSLLACAGFDGGEKRDG